MTRTHLGARCSPLRGIGLLGDGMLLVVAAAALSPLGRATAARDLQQSTHVACQGAGGAFVPVRPVRVTDTRPGSGLPSAGHPLRVGSDLTAQVGGRAAHDGVPLSACAVVLNLTVIRPQFAGLLTLDATGETPTMPGIPGIVFNAGQTTAAAVTTPMSPSGKVSIFPPPGVPTAGNIAIDVFGYYTSRPAMSGAGLYNPISLRRVFGSLRGGVRLGARSTTEVRVTGFRTGVPDSAEAVAVNLTAADSTAASYLSAYDPAAARAAVSNLNFAPGEIVGNQTMVALDRAGQIALFNHAGSVAVDVDVFGYYSAAHGTGSVYVPIDPEPVVETSSRTNGLPLPPRRSEVLKLSFHNILRQSVPGTATAVETTFEISPKGAGGYLTVYPTSDERPPTSSALDWTTREALVANESVTNQITADTGGIGKTSVFNGSQTHLNLVVYVWGYFAHEGG